MKTQLLKYALLLVLPLGLMFSSCSKDDDNDNNGEVENTDGDNLKTSIKCATFTYNTNMVVRFDDYGKKVCIDTYENGTLEGRIITFSDTKMGYVVDMTDKSMVKYNGNLYASASSFIFFSSELYYGATLTGAKATTVTIAGKKCTQYKWSYGGDSFEYAGWNGFLFKVKTVEDGVTDEFYVTKVDESAPDAKYFDVSGFTLVGTY